MHYHTIHDVVQAWLEGELEPGDRGPEVEQAQRLLNTTGAGLTVDGKLGPKTRASIEALAFERDSRDIALVRGLPLIRYDQEPSIDARPTKNFSRRVGAPQVIVLHWPGFVVSARGLGKRWVGTERDVSSHLGVDEREVVQYLPLSVSAWHATWINRFSIGVDICQGVDDDDLEAELERGKQVDLAHNTSGRGSSRYLTLDPTVRRNTLALIEGLCEQFQIPLRAPRGGDGKVRHDVVFRDARALGDWRGVLGHHHTNAAKWDVAPWWRELFAGTPIGDAR